MYLWTIIFIIIAAIMGVVAYTPVAASYEPAAEVLFLFFLAVAINALAIAFFNRRR